MSAAAATVAGPRLDVDYLDTDPAQALAQDDTLALFGFGRDAPHHDDPRYLRVPLEPAGDRRLERWRGRGPVARGRDGDLAWSEDGALQFGVIELDEPARLPDEPANGEIGRAAEYLYRKLLAFTAQRGYPQLLRIWNYLDGITLGRGDEERYRVFCVGRAAGLGEFPIARLPAATAIGRVDGARRLQVYWLASRTPGTPLENPRQVSAYRYPRQYGPQSPSFARAMLPPAPAQMPLLLSGTAAVVGHESRHAESVLAQLEETLANFDSLIGAARQHRPGLPPAFGPGSRLKVYVRDLPDLPLVAAELDRRFGDRVPRILVHAAVCRHELLVEIDGVHG
ncbi:chorismate lyase / 3-hydroxybenzoate synthase [Lysobacter sp. yr284]|uniref:chorismate transformation enzyme, FkbO/Hyg5 family n=1 Tax=Lysobacter TaxID=68 RepID=UPI000898EC25|nr:pteridine-dependent deoxygenase [Lysobacter sp. yr284]SDZ27342.1 chorismate lyase / 3-hydroxybenzoate synthase [Lysobacter sp. yr284]